MSSMNSEENIGMIKEHKKLYKNKYIAINKLLYLYIYT